MLDLGGECYQHDKRNRRVLNPRRFLTTPAPTGRPVASAAGPRLASRNLQLIARKVLSSRSGGSRFVQILHGAANVRDAENQHWHIRTCLAPAVGVVNVDIGFGEL